MPSIRDMFATPLPPLETPQERDARMAAFHKRFPTLAAVALRVPIPGMRTEAEAYGEGIEDDD